MNKIDTGGPAFPVVELNSITGEVCDQHMGMTMRDYFAAKALQGMLANSNTTAYDAAGVVDAAWAFSDAMIGAMK